nr:PREDICTED: uncharacterized protein LOC106493140 [Apteryx mantelli mantelli]
MNGRNGPRTDQKVGFTASTIVTRLCDVTSSPLPGGDGSGAGLGGCRQSLPPARRQPRGPVMLLPADAAVRPRVAGGADSPRADGEQRSGGEWFRTDRKASNLLGRPPGESVQKDGWRGGQSLQAVGAGSGVASGGAMLCITGAGPKRLLLRRSYRSPLLQQQHSDPGWRRNAEGSEAHLTVFHVPFLSPSLIFPPKCSLSWPVARGGGRARRSFAVVVRQGFWGGKRWYRRLLRKLEARVQERGPGQTVENRVYV